MLEHANLPAILMSIALVSPSLGNPDVFRNAKFRTTGASFIPIRTWGPMNRPSGPQ